MTTTTKRLTRKDVPADANLCEYCTAKCCKYFALPIDPPKTRDDFDNLRWFMLHGPISVFVDEETWFLMVHQECDKLRPDGMCGIYETRPLICRKYSTKNCEFDGDGVYDLLFETPDQIWEYAVAKLPPEHRDIYNPVLPVVTA